MQMLWDLTSVTTNNYFSDVMSDLAAVALVCCHELQSTLMGRLSAATTLDVMTICSSGRCQVLKQCEETLCGYSYRAA